ncbi:ribonuclease HI [Candidatus Saccharibacteria bacterium]|nr:ribonuclease HI [Candidatus Saccharibacteria bacterium]
MDYYTDGSCEPNPGLGGWAVVTLEGPVALGCDENTTNIRMEGLALLAAIELWEKGDTIHTDSQFWLNVLTKWAPVWEAKGWVKKGGAIANLELVQKLYAAFREKNPDIIWTRAHVGTAGNELADEWANRAREGETLG